MSFKMNPSRMAKCPTHFLTLLTGLLAVFEAPLLANASLISGRMHLDATCFDSNLEWNENNCQVVRDFQGGLDLLPQVGSQTSYFQGFTEVDGYDAVMRLDSRAALNVLSDSLSIQVEGSGSDAHASTDAAGGSRSWIQWVDQISLVWDGSGTIQPPPSNELVFTFTISGQIATHVNPDRGSKTRSGGRVEATFFPSGGNSANYTSNYIGSDCPWDCDDKSLNIDHYISGTLPLDSSHSGSYLWQLLADVASTEGFAKANVVMRLSSITFAGGRTPESLGYGIQFESGMLSPNLTVPEPSTFILCVGFVALCAARSLPLKTSDTDKTGRSESR
jgi:hypothetical protein